MRIQMPRGDIRLIRFHVLNPDKTPSDVDFTEIYFTVKRKALDEDFCFQKRLSSGGITKLDNGDYQIKIESEDTEGLRINNDSFPFYDADIELVYQDQIKQTILIQFVLTTEVTHSSNEE